MEIKCYAAPLEGVSGYVWRNAHRAVFGGADRYFTPFLAPDSNLRFQTKELRELTQGERDLVPQILTNRSDYFLWAARELQAMGYGEVNLNLGCPSGTVVAKHKGSGMLRSPEELDNFLSEIFSACAGINVSVKTRIGLKNAAEWDALLKVFERYPICELTVHPRTQCCFYDGAADRGVFLSTLAKTALPLIYNGDVKTADDAAFSYGCGVMAGRGLIANPALFRQARGGKAADRAELLRFHEMLLEGYKAYMPGQTPLMHRMRELWHYFSAGFRETDGAMKRMNKAKNLPELLSAADSILHDCPLAHETKGGFR